MLKRLFLMSLLLAPLHIGAKDIVVSPRHAMEIGLKIWKNECGGSIDGLTSWNAGEEFASMGIGHFIWYPKNVKGVYEEQFVKLLAYFEANGVALPAWLIEEKACPWKSKEAFDKEFHNQKLKDLRLLLADTFNLQVNFMVLRLEKVLPKLLAAVEESSKSRIESQFYRIARDAIGPYILIDYLNFKGDGLNPSERYQGQGWGLLQVLEQMPEASPYDPTADFIAAAKERLAMRVKNAPPERGESRWLQGWYHRLETYRQTRL